MSVANRVGRASILPTWDVDRALTAAVFLIHGPLDAGLTVFTVVSLKSTVIEANPILSRLMTDVMMWSLTTESAPSLAVAIGAVGLAKVGAVAVAVGLLHWGREIIPHWRAFSVLLAGFGLYVVVGNALHIA